MPGNAVRDATRTALLLAIAGTIVSSTPAATDVSSAIDLQGPICSSRTGDDTSDEPAKERMMRYAAIAVTLITVAGVAVAQDAGHHAAKEITPDGVVFKDDPAFPKGAQTAVLHGDPSQPGLFVIRAKFPPNYVVPPHTHPGFETVTILKGTMGSGMGEVADTSKGKLLPAGSILALPANHAHYVWSTDEELIVQVVANGPFDLIYTNPKDDPRKK